MSNRWKAKRAASPVASWRCPTAERLLLRLVPILLLAGCLGGPELEREDSAILNGQLDRDDPAVLYLELGGGNCTGSIVGPRLVLTAKHCVVDQYSGRALDRRSFGIYGGLNPLEGDGYVIAPPGSVAAVHLYDTSRNIDSADIALLETVSDLGITPVAFSGDEGNPSPGQTVAAVGFGQYTDRSFDGNKRRSTAVVQYNTGNDIWTSAITCYGDSGGPLFDGQGTVIGVTSRGTGWTCSGGDAIFTNVGHYAPWISQFVTDPVDPGGGAVVTTPHSEVFTGTVVRSSNDGRNHLLRSADDVPARARNIAVRLTGDVPDADLYCRFGGEPTTSVHDAKSDGAQSTEECRFDAPVRAGPLHVRVRAYSGTINYRVEIAWEE